MVSNSLSNTSYVYGMSQFDVVMRQIDQLLINAKKRSLNDLINVPVEVVFLDSRLESWRILTEVI